MQTTEISPKILNAETQSWIEKTPVSLNNTGQWKG